jgi:hypothetical protein
MNTKTPILGFFEEKLVEYVFDSASRPNLVFRRCLPGRIYECIAIQRDSKSNALAPNLAVTYSPSWRGEPAAPLGIDRGFPQLRRNQPLVEAIEYWYFYEPNPEGLDATLERILADFQLLAIPFFERARKQLLEDKLLQAALKAAEDFPAETRIGLTESLADVGYIVAKCEHPVFLAVRDRIRSAWSNDIPKHHRRWTSRLAYDVLAFV